MDDNDRRMFSRSRRTGQVAENRSTRSFILNLRRNQSGIVEIYLGCSGVRMHQAIDEGVGRGQATCNGRGLAHKFPPRNLTLLIFADQLFNLLGHGCSSYPLAQIFRLRRAGVLQSMTSVWNQLEKYHLMPSSRLTSLWMMKSKTLEGATGWGSLRICASKAKYSLTSSSVGTPVTVNAGLDIRYDSRAIATSVFHILASISLTSCSFCSK